MRSAGAAGSQVACRTSCTARGMSRCRTVTPPSGRASNFAGNPTLLTGRLPAQFVRPRVRVTPAPTGSWLPGRRTQLAATSPTSRPDPYGVDADDEPDDQSTPPAAV